MKPSNGRVVGLLGALALVGSATFAFADARPNPYDPIVARNPFGLRPPPPPVEQAPPPAPVVPLATVELTGVMNIGHKKALLEISPGPGKPVLKPVLAEGERLESIEVVSIDVEKNQVLIKNSGVLTNLSFKVATAKTAAAAPPGAALGAFNTPNYTPNFGAFQPPAANPAATVFNPNATSASAGSGRGSGVMVLGGGSSASPNPYGASAGAANPYGQPPAATAFQPGATTYGAGNTTLGAGAGSSSVGVYGGGSGNTDVRSIQRTIRTDPNAQTKPLSREEAYINMELQRQLHPNLNRILPPIMDDPRIHVPGSGLK